MGDIQEKEQPSMKKNDKKDFFKKPNRQEVDRNKFNKFNTL